MLDTGEWQSAFGRETEEDGTVRLVLLDRPWAGFSFLPGKDARTLTLEMAQQTYVFERANSPTPSSAFRTASPSSCLPSASASSFTASPGAGTWTMKRT